MKTLIIVAHPDLQNSRANRRWVEAVEKEQSLLVEHDRIVLQFPLYWYTCPPLLKKWLDDVLAFGWVYGLGGNKLHGKELMLAISTGGPQTAYQPGGYNNYTLAELPRPFQATSNLIGTTYLPSFTFSGIYQQSDEALNQSAQAYIQHVLNPEFRAPKLVRS